MKKIDEIRRENLLKAVKMAGSATKLAQMADISAMAISQIKNQSPDSKTGKPKSMGDAIARKIERAVGKEEGWMDTDPDFEELKKYIEEQQISLEKLVAPELRILKKDTKSRLAIDYVRSQGSCGGGFLEHNQLPCDDFSPGSKFFEKYELAPKDAVAIYADGDSMSEFIVDGDTVVFDVSKKAPRSGKIFLIEHPEGLRIKVLRLSIDGSWILECKNPNKRAFPDERISPDQIGLLKIRGQFVYRQGG